MTELDKLQFTSDIYALFPKYVHSLTDTLDAADILTDIAEGLKVNGKVVATAPKEPRTLWSVIYGNYFPREVDSYWNTEEEAEQEAERLNADTTMGMWRVERVLTANDPAPR